MEGVVDMLNCKEMSNGKHGCSLFIDNTAVQTSLMSTSYIQISYSAGVVAGVCYKNSSDDGATWSMIAMVATDATQPTIVCEQKAQTLLLQFNVSRLYTLKRNVWLDTRHYTAVY